MRKVLITGSTQGIGKAVAERLVKDGYRVTVHCSRDIEKAQRICAETGAYNAVVADLSDYEQVNALRDKTGDMDILILNASVQYKSLWTEVGAEELDRQLSVNVKSTLRLMQLYYPYMKESGFGRIITVGSVNQHRRHPELSVYAATKCAVMSLVENIAKTSAPYGVTVNNVSPGAVNTPRNAAVYDDEVKRRAVEGVIPVGRFGQPEDISGIVSFLASDESGYITGADIKVDGGMSL